MKISNSIIKKCFMAIITIVFILCPIISLGAELSYTGYYQLYNNGNGRKSGFFTVARNTSSNKRLALIDIEKTSEVTQPNVYCIRDGIGFGISDTNSTASSTNYDKQLNFRDKTDFTGKYAELLPSGDNYNKLTWLLDNIAIVSDENSVNELLSKALKGTTFEKLTQKDIENFLKNSGSSNNKNQLFQDALDGIQQSAIWYYTNAENNTTYRPAGIDINFNSNQFFYKNSNSGLETPLNTYLFGEENVDDTMYNLGLTPIDYIYDYLIRNANKNGSYTVNTSSLKLTKLSEFSNNKKLSSDGKYREVGPYQLVGNASLQKIELSSDTELVDENDNPIILTDSNLESKFYLKLPIDKTEYSIKVNYKMSNRRMYFLSTSNENLCNTYQPLVVIDPNENSGIEEDNGKVTSPYTEYKIQLKKTDNTDKSKTLAGAKFNVNYNGKDYEATTGDDGIISISNIQVSSIGNDTISFTETQAPRGYEKILDTAIFTISKDFVENKFIVKSINCNTTNGVDFKFSNTDNTLFINISDKPILKKYDLALRKFITKVGNTDFNEKNNNSRIPVITDSEVKNLVNGKATFDKGTTAKKEHTKTPVLVSDGETVIYTIRIYNEGNAIARATEVTDYLSENLKLKENSTINNKYGWVQDENTIKTKYLDDKNIDALTESSSKISYQDIQIECIVDLKENISNPKLRNIAAITGYSDEKGNSISDIDSQAKELEKSKIDNYNTTNSTKGHGIEDDDDYEDLTISNNFDLALRKFITNVSGTEISDRIPKVDTSKYGTVGQDGKIITNFTYNHKKTPVRLSQNDIVTYTIRVYNEGYKAGYASLIKDDIPNGLEFLPNNETNKEYKWKMLDANGKETTEVSNAVSITTDYRSKANEKTGGENKLSAFNGNEVSFKDVKAVFKVTIPNTDDRIITNKAQIADDSDENGKEVKDIDSTPNEWNEGEDDQDVEHVYVKYFDLSLRKWVTQAIVIEDGVTKIGNTGHKPEDDPESVVKVEVNKKRLTSSVIKFRYSIRVKNEGEIEGYAKEITDYIPSGLRFDPNDNPLWKNSGNNKITTDQLKDTLLQPGDTADVEVVLTWINGENNMKLMVNKAEISKDDNPSKTPDIDSTPNNNKTGEDDIDDAPVIIVVVTGEKENYVGLGFGFISIIEIGVLGIKRFILI